MSKTKKIILIIAAILLFLAIAAWFFIPRILLYIGIKTFDMDYEIPVTTTAEDVISSADYGTMQRIEAYGVSLEIPADYTQKEFESTQIKCVIYQAPEKEDEQSRGSVMVLSPADKSDLNFLQEGTMNTDVGVELSMKQLRKGFEAMGGPLPDSAYNTYKQMYLLTDDDYSFWNFNQGAAYFAMNTLRSVIAVYDRIEMFETEDLCGFINCSDWKPQYILEIYHKDDLNTVYNIIISREDIELMYAVLDSVEITG